MMQYKTQTCRIIDETAAICKWLSIMGLFTGWPRVLCISLDIIKKTCIWICIDAFISVEENAFVPFIYIYIYKIREYCRKWTTKFSLNKPFHAFTFIKRDFTDILILISNYTHPVLWDVIVNTHQSFNEKIWHGWVITPLLLCGRNYISMHYFRCCFGFNSIQPWECSLWDRCWRPVMWKELRRNIIVSTIFLLPNGCLTRYA